VTVVSTNSDVTYYPNGVTTQFPVDFRFIDKTDLVVTRINAEGTETTLTLDIDYTVSGGGSASGGSVQTIGAPLTGGSLTITREIDPNQLTDLRNQGDFFAEVHEDVFDKLTMLIQQAFLGLRGMLSTVRAPFPEQIKQLPRAINRAGKLLSFDIDGNPIVMVPAVTGAEGLALALANQADPTPGASLIGYMGQTLAQRFAKIRYVTDFSTVQAAINSDASLLIWPEGEYVVTNVEPRSFQTWQGVHRDKVIMKWAPVNVPTFGYSMIQSGSDIQGFHIRSMTFIGNRQYQTSESTDNQDMGCLHLRGGSVIDVSVEDFVIRDFGMLNLKGDNTTSGHGVLVGSRNGTGKKIRNIRFAHGEFRDNSNVPGVYVNGESTFNNEMNGVVVEDVDFYVDIPTAIQNCVYILGDASNIARGVKVDDVRFHLSKPIDCAIEFNWCEGFKIGTYEVRATDTGSCTPVLIRDGSESGFIGKGILHKSGTGGNGMAGISVMRFVPGTGTQKRLVIDGLHAYNWGYGGNGGTLFLSGGTSGVTVRDTYIQGDSGNFIDGGVVLGDGVSDIHLAIESWENVLYPVKYAGGATNVVIDGGTMRNCGDGVSSLIISNATGYAVTYNHVGGVRVLSRVAGTAHLVGIASTVSTGNRVVDNELPSGMQHVNQSYLTSQATIRTIAPGNGKGLLGNQYQFAQGALAIANGASFILGPNLDAQGPVCKAGDFALFTYVGDALGATIGQGYCPATGQARCRVSNHTGATINVPAGNWNVLIIPS